MLMPDHPNTANQKPIGAFSTVLVAAAFGVLFALPPLWAPYKAGPSKTAERRITIGFPESPADPAKLKADLLIALKSADRLLVLPPVFAGDNIDPETPLFEIKGHDKILSLVALMEFKDRLQANCLCDGTHRFQFFHGKNYKFSFSYHHYVALRGELGAPWFSDAILTEKSRDAVIAWFARAGFSDIKKLWDENAADNARDKKYVDEIAALFPPEARSWFPSRGKKQAGELPDRSKNLAALFPNKAELALTCWRAFGRMTTWEHHEGLHLYEEPCPFLRSSMDEVSADDIKAALLKLSAVDKEAWLGALGYFCSIRAEKQKAEFGTEWPVRLGRYYFENGPLRERSEVVREMNKLNTAEADAFLLTVGQLGLATGDKNHKTDASEDATAWALFCLAQKNHPQAKTAIFQQLGNAPTGFNKHLMEIALTHYQNQPLSVEHLAISSSLSRIGTVAWDLAKKQMTPDAYRRLLEEAANSANEDVRNEAERRGALKKVLTTASMKKPDLIGFSLIEFCTEQLKTEKDEAKRAVILSWRGKCYLETGEYELAYKDLRKSYSRERLLAEFALGRLGEAFSNVWQANSGKSQPEQAENEKLYTYLSYLTDNLPDKDDTDKGLSSDFEIDILMRLAQKRINFADPVDLKIPLKTQSGTSKFISPPTEYTTVFQTALVHYLHGEFPESELLSTMRSQGEILLGNWVIAELAKIQGNTIKVRKHLEACLATKAYTDPIYIMAHLRQQALAEGE